VDLKFFLTPAGCIPVASAGLECCFQAQSGQHVLATKYFAFDPRPTQIDRS
jgi:hypothetical protein